MTAARGPNDSVESALGCSPDCAAVRERELRWSDAERAASRAYPGLVWHEAPSWQPDEPPVSPAEMADVARDIGLLVPTREWIECGPGPEADSIVLLAGENTAPWWDVLHGRGARGESRRAETYLRVAVSKFGRFATLQQVDVSTSDASRGDAVSVRWHLGVEHRGLRDFVRAAQSVLRGHAVAVIDAAILARPARADPSERELLGHEPTLWTLLFSREPADRQAVVQLESAATA